MKPLFTGISQRRAEQKVIRTFNEKSLYPVVSSKRLLSSSQRKKTINSIKKVADLPEEYYNNIYRDLINNFVSFVQILPVNNEAKLASLLDEGLMRGLYALEIQQKESKGEIDPLMGYVIFSAALLFDVGCVIENRTVIVSLENGSFVRIWDPYHEGAMKEGDYYRIRLGGGVTPWSSRRSVMALASMLMPQVGFDWIYKNSHAFNIWLALLLDDKEGAGPFRLYFERARELLETFKTSKEFFIPLDIEEIEAKETENAEDFIAWLKEALEKGKISIDAVNGQVFHIEGDKLLFTEELFRRYVTSSGNRVSWHDVLEEFKLLGFTDGNFVKYHYAQPQATAVSDFVTTHGLGVSSLFGGGVKGEKEHEGLLQRAVEQVDRTIGVAPREEEVLKTGGNFYGIVVQTSVQGFVVPAVNYPVQVTPVTPQQALANQLPSLEDSSTAQAQQAQAQQHPAQYSNFSGNR